ncbi:MAG: bifunctional proline dehydrogenase/L-glutamate gamma-semialdehyde dehydrogenase PutA, partial [Robiginitomaculum sp.]|nr:bifunctional proline dehydrogenase/L-glutamate gamma-semialdehyde dehydrogenase PutA [Robiginitomaculum sp.]
EKISSGDWGEHKGQSESWLVNASTWGLMLTGSIIDVDGRARKDLGGFMKSMTRQVGEPVIRGAMMQAMRIMGEQFVVGRTIETALERAKTLEPGKKPAICSFDMLGEAARTAKDAQRYYDAYSEAIFALGSAQNTKLHPAKKSGISVKLSALHPRYETIKERRLFTELYPKIKSLAVQAAQANINFTLDAEESDRLVISLKLLEKLVNEEELGDWEGLGLAVQAYQKRGLAVCGKLAKLARECRGGKGRKLMVRLVKGAYWDSEIKLAQMAGHPDFPVWTRKATTDLAYLACARSLLDAGTWIYAQFATHNAHTVAAIEEMVRGGRGQRSGTHYEFQRLHGMGDALYAAVYNGPGHPAPCRVYAPVGAHEDLLPYLVRRLLENGANTSFVHSFLDDSVPAEHVAKSPFLSAAPTRHDKIPSPPMLFGEVRKNSRGLDLTQKPVRVDLEKRCGALEPILAGPIVRGKTTKGVGRDVIAPASGTILGTCRYANEKDIYAAYSSAEKAFSDWDKLGGCARAKILLKMADALEDKTEDFTALMALEAGKCFEDGFSEVREAVDFLRYYAGEAMNNFSEPKLLPGPSGETNHLSLCGRGVFVCISPWNFPLAIFIGQIAAALAAGNTVLAKPAEQTSLIAFETVKLFQKSGLPKDVLHMLTGTGQDIGAKLVNLPDIAGVCFTGSTEVAQIINRN